MPDQAMGYVAEWCIINNQYSMEKRQFQVFLSSNSIILKLFEKSIYFPPKPLRALPLHKIFPSFCAPFPSCGPARSCAADKLLLNIAGKSCI
jgi:hypothetical protein